MSRPVPAGKCAGSGHAGHIGQITEAERLIRTFLDIADDVADPLPIPRRRIVRHTHEKFTHVSTDGARRDRREYLRRWATGFDPDVIIYWDTRDERISVFGNVAPVWSVNKHVIASESEELTGMTGYTDTYLHEGGSWQCIQAQLVTISPENYPPDKTIVRKYIRGELQEKTESIESVRTIP